MIERAEIGTRPKVTQTDRRQYRGIAQVPLARKWMTQRVIEARDKADHAKDEATRQHWLREAERLQAELRELEVR